MSRFTPLLLTLDDTLVLPQPARSRVLLEIAGDMEAFFELAREQGRSEGEAESLAVDAFHPSSETVAALVRVHGSPIVLLMDGLSSQAQSVWERLLLAIAIIPALVMGLLAISDLRIFRVAGPAAWPVIGMALASAVLVLLKLYQLYLKLDHRPRILGRGLQALFWLSVAPAPLGLLAFILDLFRSLGALGATWPEGGADLVRALLRGSAVMTLALTATLLGGGLWFLLSRKIARIEQQEAELLLGLNRRGDSDV